MRDNRDDPFTFEGGDLAIALGHGGFYDHSDTSNAEYVKDSQNNQVVFTAIRDIEPGEEITIGYDSWAKRAARSDAPRAVGRDGELVYGLKPQALNRNGELP